MFKLDYSNYINCVVLGVVQLSQLNKLSPLEVQKTKKLGWLADGGGLYLRTRKSGSKSWVFRHDKNKVKRDFIIGPLHTVSLANARKLASECRLAALEGRSIEAVFASKEGPKTFESAALAIIERRRSSWKSEKTAIKWRRGLMDHAKPLHKIPVSQITIQDVENILLPIWYSHNHSARMTRGMIEQALDLATVLGWREGDNPARWKGGLEHLLPDYAPKIQHHAAMPYKEVPKFIQGLMESNSYVTVDALILTILTASRGHMVRHADWSEFDLDEKLWTIPAERMKKSDEDHVIPLTDQMLSLLPRKTSGLVFPYRGKGFSENAFRSTLKSMSLEYTAHGFRSSFKDWAADQTEFADEVSEMALAHKVGTSVRRAYRRGKGLNRRRRLMEAWCAHCYSIK